MTARIACVLLAFVVAGCGPQGANIFTNYSSSTFGFSVQLDDDLERAGWGVIDAENATVRHTFTPPDTSTWEAVAVVVPPGSSFPLLSPLFIDIFNVKVPEATALSLADDTANRLGDRVLSRQTLDAGGVALAQIVHGAGDDINYETYAVGNGLGYAFLAQGAPITSAAANFRLDTVTYD